LAPSKMNPQPRIMQNQNDWLKERLEISRKIRATLVSFYIDLGVMQIMVSPYRTSLKGQLKCLPGSHMKLSGQVIEEILRAISRVPNVGNVRAEFDNWYQESSGGPWTEGAPGQAQMVSNKKKRPSDIKGEGIYTIRKKSTSESNEGSKD